MKVVIFLSEPAVAVSEFLRQHRIVLIEDISTNYIAEK